MSATNEVGYKRPPRQHQFQKGQSGNPTGRGKKQKKSNEPAMLMRSVGEEEITVAGRTMTKDEALLQVVLAKALKGDMQAAKLYYHQKDKLGLTRTLESVEKRGGVLVIPAAGTLEEWEAKVFKNQAKYRGEDPEGLAKLNGSLAAALRHPDPQSTG